MPTSRIPDKSIRVKYDLMSANMFPEYIRKRKTYLPKLQLKIKRKCKQHEQGHINAEPEVSFGVIGLKLKGRQESGLSQWSGVGCLFALPARFVIRQ